VQSETYSLIQKSLLDYTIQNTKFVSKFCNSERLWISQYKIEKRNMNSKGILEIYKITGVYKEIMRCRKLNEIHYIS